MDKAVQADSDLKKVDEEDDDENVPRCRICFAAEETPENPFVKPCLCSGTLQVVHNECGLRWMMTRGGKARCEVCTAVMETEADYKNEVPVRTTLQVLGLLNLYWAGTCLKFLPLFIVIPFLFVPFAWSAWTGFIVAILSAQFIFCVTYNILHEIESSPSFSNPFPSIHSYSDAKFIDVTLRQVLKSLNGHFGFALVNVMICVVLLRLNAWFGGPDSIDPAQANATTPVPDTSDSAARILFHVILYSLYWGSGPILFLALLCRFGIEFLKFFGFSLIAIAVFLFEGFIVCVAFQGNAVGFFKGYQITSDLLVISIEAELIKYSCIGAFFHLSCARPALRVLQAASNGQFDHGMFHGKYVELVLSPVILIVSFIVPFDMLGHSIGSFEFGEPLELVVNLTGTEEGIEIRCNDGMNILYLMFHIFRMIILFYDVIYVAPVTCLTQFVRRMLISRMKVNQGSSTFKKTIHVAFIYSFFPIIMITYVGVFAVSGYIIARSHDDTINLAVGFFLARAIFSTFNAWVRGAVGLLRGFLFLFPIALNNTIFYKAFSDDSEIQKVNQILLIPILVRYVFHLCPESNRLVSFVRLARELKGWMGYIVLLTFCRLPAHINFFVSFPVHYAIFYYVFFAHILLTILECNIFYDLSQKLRLEMNECALKLKDYEAPKLKKLTYAQIMDKKMKTAAPVSIFRALYKLEEKFIRDVKREWEKFRATLPREVVLLEAETPVGAPAAA
ncbi:hypothetical protein L596_029027 [Steinernema carpocapsae]|uniref:RING-CH-type domain-containing protein n=1 Tax=Steinernema carpocapsae TaxID=34508 RepID=A0A4U5LTE7_STECR|nr:hypothetical protein L596_029027 [Steinernema carpocapsae]